MPATLVGRDAHHDVALANYAIQAFASGADAGYIGEALFPTISPVAKQNDRYYKIDPDSYLRVADSRRSPGVAANRVEWKVSSDGFFCDNYALADEIPLEDLANADGVLNARQGSADFITDNLLRDREQRIANKVTSVSNVGSGVVLSGNNQWSAVQSADILGQISTGRQHIHSRTGILPNVLAMDWKSWDLMTRNERLIELFKNVQGGRLTKQNLLDLFELEDILVSKAVKNTANEGAAAAMASVWGDAAVLAYVNPRIKSQRVTTFGVGFRWIPQGMRHTMQAFRDRFDKAGEPHTEVVEVGYYADEKIVGQDLAYAITDTQA